ncbi:unnamed protein product [Adineta ricciae]|uniref:Uncharacterized protein n=1 Tax=Adineta ricciae TaxID=249248 RepID=A0A816D4Z8_ADIRI|nr:unnamed protein product [Adineta ricciae]
MAQNSNSKKHPHLKSVRLIELSDHILRLHRRENAQLDLRLQQLDRRERVILANYDREIYYRRLQLAQIYKSLDEPPPTVSPSHREETPISFYSIKMRRYQSAPPDRQREKMENNEHGRPTTTADSFRANRRAMSVFREITVKQELPSLNDMLVFADIDKKSSKNQWIPRSKTMFDLKEDY